MRKLLAFSLFASTAFAGSETKLDGYAEWRRDDTLIVEGQRVRVGPETRFSGEGAARSFQSIPLGYEVKVKGRRLADGSVLASQIEAKPNGVALFESQLQEAFDETERRWRRHGRVFDEGNGGRVNLGRLRDSGADVARVRRITERLVPPYRDRRDFRVYVVDNDEWNAMAAPNGSIYVFRGLLEDMDDDELAIILGHELVHATHEHSRKQYKRSLWTQLAVAGGLAFSERGGRGASGIATTAVGLGALTFVNHYSREHEDQADRVGLRYSREAGYDVEKAPSLWLRFARKYGDRPEALNFFFGSHSTPKSRARSLEREIGINYR
ncbi:MAG TPA: M48 family metalloprotease [Vicinamibacteria bacterium]|nr:M48 family metalloprotease [Vicinamibacteria bacterium]